MRSLRGTRLDLFGYDNVRREERRLIEDYVQAMSTALTVLSPATRDLVLEFAGLPDIVRGYESIKIALLERYHMHRAELLSTPTDPSSRHAHDITPNITHNTRRTLTPRHRCPRYS